MSEDYQALVLDLRLNMKRIEQQTKKLNRHMGYGFKTLTNSTDRQLSKLEARAEQSANAIRNVIAAAAVGLVGREIVQAGDQWVTYGNKIAAAGQVAGREGRGILELADAAREARSDIEPYIDLYARLLRSSAGIAESEKEVARATELTAKAFSAGGASAIEQAAGILQLGQALGSGFLQGDELRSIRENAPLVAKAIADAMGVSIGELKALGAEGKLTSDIVFQALLDGADDIEAAFGVTIPKGSQAAQAAFQRLRLELGKFVEESGTVRGGSELVAGAVNFIAENLDALTDAIIVTGAAMAGLFGAQAVSGLVSNMGKATAGLTAMGRAMAVVGVASKALGGPVVIGVATLAGALAFLATRADESKTALKRFDQSIDDARSSLDRLDALMPSPFDDIADLSDEAATAVSGLTQEYRDLKAAMEASGQAAKQMAVDEAASLVVQLTQDLADLQRAALRDAAGRANSAGPTSALRYERDPNAFGISSAFQTQIDEIESLLDRAIQKRDELLQAPKAKFKPEPSSGTKTKTDDDGKARDLAVKSAEQVIAALERAAKTERQIIQDTLDERLAAIDLIRGAEADIARLRQMAYAQAASGIAELESAEQARRDQAMADLLDQMKRKSEAVQAEKDLLRSVQDERDRMQGRYMAAELAQFDLKRQMINAEIADARRKADALRAIDEQEAAYRQRIRATLPGQGGSVGGGVESEVEQIRAVEAEKLAALQEAYDAQIIQLQEFEARRRGVIAESEAEIQAIRQQSWAMAARGASDGFGALASIAKDFAGEQSGIYKGLFAVSKAFAIAESIIKIQQGIANALSLPFPANIGAAAAVAGQAANIVSTIKSTNLSGARAYGGDVKGGQSYVVGERGREVFTPGASGQITSAENIRQAFGDLASGGGGRGGGGMKVQLGAVNVYNAPAGTSPSVRARPDGGIDIDLLGKQLAGQITRGGTPFSAAIEALTGGRGRAAV